MDDRLFVTADLSAALVQQSQVTSMVEKTAIDNLTCGDHVGLRTVNSEMIFNLVIITAVTRSSDHQWHSAHSMKQFAGHILYRPDAIRLLGRDTSLFDQLCHCREQKKTMLSTH